MRTRLSASLAFLALAVMACQAPAPAATGSAEDEQAIRTMADKYSAAYSARDTAALAALVSEDYQDVDPTGRHTQGRAAFAAAVAQELAMMPANASVSMKAATTYVRWIDANHAVAGGTWEVSPAMPGAPSRGSWMGVMVKEDTTWRMMSALGSPDMTTMMQDTTRKP